MTTRLHPLDSAIAHPERLNNPMGYIPHPLCLKAMEEVEQYLLCMREWQEEINNGKMFGVLVVEDERHNLGFLAAFSGLLADHNDWDYFVPPVFDFLQPEGYFKQEEHAISAISSKVKMLEGHPSYIQAISLLQNMQKEKDNDLMGWKEKMEEAKKRRDTIRQTTTPDTETMAALQRESQWMKAELRRKRQYHNQLISQQNAIIENHENEIRKLKKERQQKSDALQQWLFSHFVMKNASPKGEVRKHMHSYPACRGKCLPILNFMLQGLDVEDNIYEKAIEAIPNIVYEDEWLIVVDKPAGMLSVPGKQESTSVYDFVKCHCPEAEGPLIVHRLDMSTSGLILVAKTKQTHQDLQAQFHHRKVKKTYLARLEHDLPATVADKGIISIPLRPYPLDRPRQLADPINGKPAVTTYTRKGSRDVVLQPQTGRTHQLRVHCAHHDGLGTPILGDTLYGTPADRLYLHASQLTITHPVTKKIMTFHSPCPWK